MKEKLRERLVESLQGAGGERRKNIKSQLLKISSADISTIHSFCSRLIKTYFYALDGIDSSFEVLADGKAQSELKERVIENLFAELYEKGEEGAAEFYNLLSCLKRKRSDRALKDAIFEAYDKIRIRPNYREMLQKCCRKTFTEAGFTAVKRKYFKEISLRCKNLLSSVEEFRVQFRESYEASDDFSGFDKILEEMEESLKSFASGGDIFSPPENLHEAKKPRKKAGNERANEEFSAFTNGVKERFKKLFKDIDNEQAEREAFFKSGELAKSFTGLLLSFDTAYSEVKREEGKLDYGDLEHFAYRLLVGKDCDKDVLGEIKNKYKYVFVDEYQDVNPIQESIISAVSSEEEFCVGDVKQAIYGFRGSCSRFFGSKSSSIAKSKGKGEYLILPDNFRSAEGIINFVNGLFKNVMVKSLCSFDYTAGKHKMRGGDSYKKQLKSGEKVFPGSARVFYYDASEEEKEGAEGIYSVGSTQKEEGISEGDIILKLIESALKSKRFDPVKKKEVPVEQGDICILTRKRANGSARSIMRAVSEKYPVTGAAEVNICNRPEIKKLLNVLSYIDNAEQDIPFTAALLSPLGGFTEAELVKLRAYGGTGKDAPPFRVCAENYFKAHGGGLSLKLEKFYGEVERLKELSTFLGAARLIDELVKVGDFPALFNGEIKLAALRRLQKEAFSPLGELSLAAFLESIKKGGNKILAPSSLGADCVKVMTMHASKGLEFPVVILADIARTFAGDSRSEMLFSEEFGFAPRYYISGSRTYKSTLLRKYVRLCEEREELANEINLFYVACTRAEYMLYILTSDTEVYRAYDTPYAKNYASLFKMSKVKNAGAVYAENVDTLYEEGAKEENKEEVVSKDNADGAIYEKIKQAANFNYGEKYGSASALPVKSSASRLIAAIGEEAGNPVRLFSEEEKENGERFLEYGKAYHKFLELCDFSIRTRKGIEEELNLWCDEGLMEEDMRGLLDIENLLKILSMPAFNKALSGRTYREREFICKLSASDYSKLTEGRYADYVIDEKDINGVIVQGAIDLLVVNYKEGKAVSAQITDYKYSVKEAAALKEKYSAQLALYKSVVREIYKLPAGSITCEIINIRRLENIPLNI